MDHKKIVHDRADMEGKNSPPHQKRSEVTQLEEELPKEGQADLTQCPFSVHHYSGVGLPLPSFHGCLLSAVVTEFLVPGR